MRNIFSKFALSASIMLAMVFTFACSSDDGNNNNGGTSSGSGGGGGSDQNSPLYDKDGTTPRNISGVIRLKKTSIEIGKVTNGAVTIDLPITGLDDYLSTSLGKLGKAPCPLPSNMKIIVLIDEDGMFQLISSTGEVLGTLKFRYSNDQIYETMFYLYSTKEEKITCNYDKDDEGVVYENVITNLDVKERWNKVYIHRGPKINSVRTSEWNTNNILTQQLKWTFHPLD